jgi:hypothetical protein
MLPCGAAPLAGRDLAKANANGRPLHVQGRPFESEYRDVRFMYRNSVTMSIEKTK